jgi:hypothetical protein
MASALFYARDTVESTTRRDGHTLTANFLLSAEPESEPGEDCVILHESDGYSSIMAILQSQRPHRSGSPDLVTKHHVRHLYLPKPPIVSGLY